MMKLIPFCLFFLLFPATLIASCELDSSKLIKRDSWWGKTIFEINIKGKVYELISIPKKDNPEILNAFEITKYTGAYLIRTNKEVIFLKVVKKSQKEVFVHNLKPKFPKEFKIKSIKLISNLLNTTEFCHKDTVLIRDMFTTLLVTDGAGFYTIDGENVNKINVKEDTDLKNIILFRLKAKKKGQQPVYKITNSFEELVKRYKEFNKKGDFFMIFVHRTNFYIGRNHVYYKNFRLEKLPVNTDFSSLTTNQQNWIKKNAQLNGISISNDLDLRPFGVPRAKFPKHIFP